LDHKPKAIFGGLICSLFVQACKVANDMWSKVGRLKRSQMPRLTGGGATFGAGAGPGAMACIAGRLLCDTYVSSRELLREVIFHVYLGTIFATIDVVIATD
jgi:hypothetical protein